MAGLDKSTPIPEEIKLHQQSRIVEISYAGGEIHRLSCEFLRVFTPSAEARGHGPGQEKLQYGKKDVEILSIEPVGNYALRFVFSDGHDTGLYSWDLLYNLGQHRDVLWHEYLVQLDAQGLSRDPGPEQPSAPKTSCGKH